MVVPQFLRETEWRFVQRLAAQMAGREQCALILLSHPIDNAKYKPRFRYILNNFLTFKFEFHFIF